MLLPEHGANCLASAGSQTQMPRRMRILRSCIPILTDLREPSFGHVHRNSVSESPQTVNLRAIRGKPAVP